MDLNDMAPAGGGELRGSPAEPVRQTVGTFTPTQAQHPDEIWSPRGGELAPPDRPLGPSRDATQEGLSPSGPCLRPTWAATDQWMHPVVRAALRPGLAG